MTEQRIQRGIILRFEARGCEVTKYNANGYGKSGKTDLYVSVPPSVTGVPFPVALYVEVKTPKGRLSLIQKVVIGEMEARGHLVAVFRSPEEVDRLLDALVVALAPFRDYTVAITINRDDGNQLLKSVRPGGDPADGKPVLRP